jgi:hypothetical protein
MGWEDRNGKRYYYRKRREGRRVVSEYIGSGFMGELAEDMDLVDRAENHQARQLWKTTKQSADAIASQARQVEKVTQAMTRALLLLSGYHVHKRQWRKRRDGRRNKDRNRPPANHTK